MKKQQMNQLLCSYYQIKIQVSKMNPQTLQYLKQDEVGKVIAKGLANLYSNKPEKPVKYLAQWLLNYSSNRRQMQRLLQVKKTREASLNVFEQTNKIRQIKEKEQNKVKQTLQDRIKQFKEMIKNHQYQFELLKQKLPQFIQEHTDITGAYIGELNFPKKIVTEEDDGENAHLDQSSEKVINYIGSSLSHKNLMQGKILPLNKGVTAKAFTLEEQAPPPAQQGQQQAVVEKQKYIYIPNVVKNEQMHYFKIPKFGAYLAVPLIYDSYLSEPIFDGSLEAKNKYYGDLKEFEEKKKEELEQMNADKNEIQKKINELKQKNAQQSVLEPEIAELAKIEEEIRTREAEKFQEEPPELQLNKPKFVVCVDNIGKDRQLTQKDITFIYELVQHFKISWSNKQKQLLNKDVNTHIQLIKSLPQPIETLYENINKQFEEVDEEKTEELNQIENQSLKDYKQEEYCVGKLKQHIKTNSFYLNSFLKLKEFRVVKYRNVIQNILYFLGYPKSQINEPEKASLNWKQVKVKNINEENFNKILEYIIQGPKQGEFKPYAKTPVLSELFESYDEQAIFVYNVGLGAIVKYIKAALKHRVSNVELRKSQKEKERSERDEIIAENQIIVAQKAKELEKEKENIPAEELENFNQEEWSAKYDEKVPPKEVPPEIIDDIDNDM